jgi:hypothetical protein
MRGKGRPTMTSKRYGLAALRNGVLFGSICAVVYIGSAFIQDVTGTTLALASEGSTFRPLSLLNQATLVLAVVLFFVAGWRTSKVDERFSSAALAGLFAALIVTVVEIATIIVNQRLIYNAAVAALVREHRMVNCGFQCTLLLAPGSQATLTFFIYITLGAGFGFIAGLLRSQVRQQALWR